MKRLFISLFITLIIFLSSNGYAQQGIIESDPFKIVTANAITSTVKIITETDRGFGRCSGVVIKNTPTKSVILTAKHCLSFQGDMYINSLKVNFIGISLKADLVYLILNEFIPNKTPVKLSNHIPINGEEIVIVGFPKSKLYTDRGNIFVQTPKEQYAFIKAINGCSGGGAFNSSGNLIGIVIRYYPKINISVFVRLEDIHTLININKLLE